MGPRMSSEIWIRIGMIVGIIMPFFNLAQIWRMIKFKSSHDISMPWALGVWVCAVLMLPSALMSVDPVYRIFSMVNITLFSGLVGTAVFYRITKRS